jgi:serine/threonine protein kinase
MHDIGSTMAGWQLVRVLHQGSMAVTYEVRPDGARSDGVLVPRGRYVLKLMFLRDPSFQERLRRVGEAQRGARHPHLVDIVDVIDVDGSVGVVSPYVDGVDLATWAQAGHPVPEVVVLFRKLVDGVVAAHDRGLVHRNLKPQKVLITADGEPHLHDFMLGKTLTTDSAAALTQMGTTFGTPQYMSPEQFRGAADVDARTDLFSLGCLLFELLTGRRAFDGTGLMDIYQQVSKGSAPPPSTLNPEVPPALDALVAALLAVDRDARPASARIVADRIDHDPTLRALCGLAPLDPPPPPSTTTPPPPSRVESPALEPLPEGVEPRRAKSSGDTLLPPSDPWPGSDDDTDILEEPPDVPGPAADPTLEEAPDAIAAADPRPKRGISAPVPPPPLAASGTSGNVWMAILLVVLGVLAAVLGLVAGSFVF